MRRRLLILIIGIFSLSPLCRAQDYMIQDISRTIGEWNAAFSPAGRRNWRPEITLRAFGGFVSSGHLATIGARIDSKRTIGLMLGHTNVYNDAAPASVDLVTTCLYKRRYFRRSPLSILAVYSDLAIGADWVYRSNCGVDPVTGVSTWANDYRYTLGSVRFKLSWQPGIRIRFIGNAHIFAGPVLATDCVGLHLGVGI